MRICLVSLDYKPFRSSGLTIYAEDLARGLLELGHSPTVIAARRPGLPMQHQVDGVAVYRTKVGPLDWLTYSWYAAHLVRQLNACQPFDVIHFLDVHFAYAYRGSFVASLWQSFRQRLTANFGHPYHHGFCDRLRRELYYRLAARWMEMPSLARAGRLIASCHSTRDEFIQHYHVPPEKVDLGIQGFDNRIFHPVPDGELRQRLGLVGKRILLFVGFMNARKGLEYLAQAMQRLPPDVHLLLVGRWDPPYRQRFYQAIGTAADRVHEAGFVSDEERPLYYSLADLYVSPSLLEGLGITPIEAQACGTPAIVTSASSGPEEVADPVCLVPPGDAPALAQAIQALLQDPEQRRRLAEAGRQRVLAQFSYRRMAELTLQMYTRFVAPKNLIDGR